MFQATPKGTIREAFNSKIIPDGQARLDTIDSRKLSAHTYNRSVAQELTQKIISQYADTFLTFEQLFARYQREA